MRRLLVLACLLVAVPVAAQSPIPGGVLVHGGWVPCDHPIAVAAGVGCTVTTPGVPAISGGALATFIPGHRYEMPYGHQMRVIALAALDGGDAAVTCVWELGAGGIQPPGPEVGDLFAFRLSSSMARKWWAVE